MFGVDRSHVARGRGDPAGKAKPYSGPTDPVGWLATAARHALSHHHPESFAPHVVFPPYLLVKVCGPKRAVAVATGAAAGRAAFAAAAARGLALSLCYVMHADWFNDVCDVDVDAKNKPERPLPSGACSRAQGLLVAAFYGCLGLGVTRTPPEPALRRAYAAAFAAMGAAAFLYSDDRLPTRRLARCAPLGRALAFCGIYAAFDALMYVEACDALGLAPAPFAANPLFGAFIWAAAATVPWNLALLVAKDLGDVPGDAAAGLRTLPAALPDDRSAGCLVLALLGLVRVIDAAGHVAGAYAPAVDLGPLGRVPVQAPALLLDGLALGYYAAVARTLDLDGSRAKRSAFLGRFWRLQAGCLALAFYEHRAPQTGA